LRTRFIFLPVFLLTTSILAQAPTFRVLVLDALNGEPQPQVEVDYFCEGQGFKGESAKTGLDGKAEIPYKCKGEARIEISLIPLGNKDECGGVDALEIGDILTNGFISEPTGAGNDWCPNKQRRKLHSVPGQVTVFVKKPTWWQAHVAG
jgi:hypothetical protein